MKTHLKVKLCTLGYEAKIIRRLEEEWKKSKQKGEHPLRQDLYHHRIHVVRPETRAVLLAYGFLRGRDYLQVENSTKSKPNWSRVIANIKTFGGDYPGIDERDLMQRFSEWIEAVPQEYRPTLS